MPGLTRPRAPHLTVSHSTLRLSKDAWWVGSGTLRVAIIVVTPGVNAQRASETVQGQRPRATWSNGDKHNSFIPEQKKRSVSSTGLGSCDRSAWSETWKNFSRRSVMYQSAAPTTYILTTPCLPVLSPRCRLRKLSFTTGTFTGTRFSSNF
jgi:hypothetical protein